MNFAFETLHVKKEVADILRVELPTKGYRNVKVITADPATPAEVPCVCVNRLSDDESNQSLGDSSGTGYDEETKTHFTYQGTFFSESVEVRIWHTNSDERDELYQQVKAILFAYRQELVQKGILDVTLRGGKDEQDATMQNAPFVVYWGSISMSYLNPLNVEITEIVEPISGFTDDGALTAP